MRAIGVAAGLIAAMDTTGTDNSRPPPEDVRRGHESKNIRLSQRQSAHGREGRRKDDLLVHSR